MSNKNPSLVGISNFCQLVERDRMFIDKTLFIKDVMDDDAKIILISRPHRFGKTLAITMLGEFLSFVGKDVFKGLNISKNLEFCARYQNQYPVVSISFKECRASNFQDIFMCIKSVFSQCYKDHMYLLESPAFLPLERRKFELIMRGKNDDSVQLLEALSSLIAHLYVHTSRKVIVLVDGYDTPIHSGYSYGFYDG